MRYTFKSDDCMVITIPLANLRSARDGQLMPEKFSCVFKDMYKVFLRGRPKSLGFIGCGILTYAAGHSPLMPVMKMSFIFNIIGLFWAIAALAICPLMYIGLKGVLVVLHALQFILAAVMIFWESKAVCRTHFNTL
uniref:Si:ch211-269k10.5 n=1 Tax=Astyanax mexicanus TaxID=7994 RepID=A0A3B1KCM9_ASTMX